MTRRKIEFFDPHKFYLLEVPDRAATPSWSNRYVNDRSTYNYYVRRLEARRAAYPASYPGFLQGAPDPLWLNDLRLDASTIRPYSTFTCAAPKTIGDFLWLDRDFDATGYTFLVIVSQRWRDVIDHLEPGKHQFFPHELRFEGGTVLHHYVFYHRARVDAIDYVASGCMLGTTRDGKAEIWIRPSGWNQTQIKLRRTDVSGLHYFHSTGGEDHDFYSPAAAAMLQPLLPSRCYFTAISCQ